jgi:hypothetical protein
MTKDCNGKREIAPKKNSILRVLFFFTSSFVFFYIGFGVFFYFLVSKSFGDGKRCTVPIGGINASGNANFAVGSGVELGFVKNIVQL